MKETFIEVIHGRQNPAIDPTLHIWGWEIPVYLFLGGLVAGMMILVAVRELRTGERPASRGLRWAPWISVGLLTVGMIALFLDLAHKSHFWRFYLALKPTSPMSWGSWILLLVYPVALLHGLGSLPTGDRDRLRRWRPVQALRLSGLLDWAWRLADGRRRVLLWSSVVIGAALGLYTGLLLGTMAARPIWSSALLGPLFLTSGISTGAALLLLLRLDDGERHALVRWDMIAIGAELTLLAIMLLGFMAGDGSSQLAGRQLLGGPFTASFWSLVIIGGLAVPLLMEILELRKGLPLKVITPILILLGGLALRWILVSAGQATSFRMLAGGGG